MVSYQPPSLNPANLRQDNINRLDGGQFDVFVIGGGINGAVSAAALVDRGLSVGLAERGDFAGFTSQESSNLVWGGFKYLQNYELPLVFKLCRSRNRLMKAYPTNIAEVRFLATLDKSAPFPSWLAALGSFGYWGIGAFSTKRPGFFRKKKLEVREPVIATEEADAAIEYADAYLKDNDARFVWGFIRSALDRGASVANYLNVVHAEHHGEAGWTLHLKDEIDGKTFTCSATTIINAAGPFVDGLNDRLDVSTDHRVVYSKGIHLVVRQLTSSERILAFFDDTQRLFYVIPMAHRSVIGTTDTRTDSPDEPVTDEDREFLLTQINARLDLANPLTKADIIAERSGVRPLVVTRTNDTHEETDWTSLSRKHEIEIDTDRQVITIFGGKLTDCLNVGEEAIDAVKELGLPLGPGTDDWFGEPSDEERQAFYQRAAEVGLHRPPEVERADSMAEVLWRRHGLAAQQVIDAIADDKSLDYPALSGSDILRAELPIFRDREMIVSLEDFLRRRTKLALIHRQEDLAVDPGMAEVNQVLNIRASTGSDV